MKTFSITDAGAIREMNQDFYFSSDTAVEIGRAHV